MCLCVFNLNIIVFFYYIGMNFASIKKVVASVASGVVLVSSFTFSALPVLADEVVEPVIEQRGTGGSNPLVVAKLRAEGRERQNELLNQEANKNLALEFSNIKESVDVNSSRYNTQKLPEYIPDFKTIGDVKAEEEKLKNELVSIVTKDVLEEKVEEMTSVIEGNNFTTQFADIQNSDKKDSIIILDAFNIVSGKENTKFKPNEAITRKEAIKISELISGKTIKSGVKSSVLDIDSSDWSVPYVEFALDNDIISLEDGNILNGDFPVTSGEAFALYLLASGVCVDLDEEKFPFYSQFKNDYSSEIVISNYETDLIENKEVTREDFAEISVNILNTLFVNSEYTPSEQLLGGQYSASQQINIGSVRDELLKIFNK